MNPNATQVGGTHYDSQFQHWDFVNTMLYGRYLEGCATKYVSRWRKKNGTQDLLKAIHYIDKIISLHTSGHLNNQADPDLAAMYRLWSVKYPSMHDMHTRNMLPKLALEDLLTEKLVEGVYWFCDSNGLKGKERTFVYLMTTWASVTHLEHAKALVLNLIDEAEPV